MAFFSGLYFLVFRLNKRIYRVNVRIQSISLWVRMVSFSPLISKCNMYILIQNTWDSYSSAWKALKQIWITWPALLSLLTSASFIPSLFQINIFYILIYFYNIIFCAIFCDFNDFPWLLQSALSRFLQLVSFYTPWKF